MSNMDDEHLSYYRAIIRDIEKCNNSLWLGTPQTATEYLFINRTLISKDTVLVLNIWVAELEIWLAISRML
jgi:hypothetical protein